MNELYVAQTPVDVQAYTNPTDRVIPVMRGGTMSGRLIAVKPLRKIGAPSREVLAVIGIYG